MTAVELIRKMRHSGLKITVEGGNLRISPRKAVTDELKRELAQNKSALIEVVLNENRTRCTVCRGDHFWQGDPIYYSDGSTGPAPWVCRTCHPPPNEGMVRRVLP